MPIIKWEPVDLPGPVNASKTQAEYKEGVLIVTMPVVKGEQEKTVRIKVRT